MKAKPAVSTLNFFFPAALLALIAFVATSAHATPTIWSGPNTNYTQTVAHPTDVLIPGTVSLGRGQNFWLFNANVESGAATGTPSDTEWAFGAIANFSSLSYQPFSSLRNGNINGQLLTGGPGNGPRPMVVHLINQDIYLQLTFSAWGQHGAGSFSYTRSTPAVVGPTPSVSITNPAAASVFAAPANVTILAGATVSSGTVTNVSFFGNANVLGSKQTAPFTITANSLSAGPYALTAVATAAGVSATSSVVNISVVTPVATSLSAPGITNNQFSLSYSANPGLRYVLEDSSNLFDWTPVVTNVAAGNPSFFTNPISGDDTFYRVGRLPNP
jgi:hypothetical protein